ncbi:hypothetical protein [Ciceribacter selenitireducens]|uniref:hypothetical protein n=1 Tax=Ciceribacter selenitireducens TaxID=448181 RepID=UPI0004907D49|nr:hypothetical protein [Ciceribacter selenitireducens]
MARKKSSFEKFFSFSRHRKRWGGGKFAVALTDYEPLKTRLVENTDKDWRKGHQEDIAEHIANLRVEFAGKAELLFEHAKLIVLIRREYKAKEMYAQFRAMWDKEADYLAENLNMRWLISAADTFADHDQHIADRSIALMTSAFATTIKIYETERYITASENNTVLQQRVATLQPDQPQTPLFDGMCLFRVGTDDTLRNLHWRLKPFFKQGAVGKIAAAIYERMQINDTAFARLRRLHHRSRTMWW